MKNLIFIGLIAALTFTQETTSYSWEDASGTILGSYGNLANPANVGTTSGISPHDGSRMLTVSESPISGTPQAFIAWVTDLSAGQDITACFYGYDNTPSSAPSLRVWGSWTANDDIYSYQGSADGNNDYTAGTGWDQVCHTFSTNQENWSSGEALVIQARLYSSASGSDPTVYFIDLVEVTAPNSATIKYPDSEIIGCIDPNSANYEPNATAPCNSNYNCCEYNLTISEILSGLYQDKLVTTDGTIVFYHDKSSTDGPHAITIEDENGISISVIIWPNQWDITNPDFECSTLDDVYSKPCINIIKPPFNIHSMRVTGIVGEFYGKQQIEINNADNFQIIDIYSCMDNSACNYNPDATADDDFCLYPDECGVCGGNNAPCLLPFGTDSTLDIITWNIETFPKRYNTTQTVYEIINALEVDIISLQEIQNGSYFLQLVNELINSGASGDWVSYRTGEDSNNIELAYLINGATVEIIEGPYTILEEGSDYFAKRLPYVLEVSYSGKNLFIINNHFKCCGDGSIDENDNEDEEYRRQQANLLLEEYINNNFADKNVIILGDLNDEIQEEEANNVFWNFISKPDEYLFADMDIAMGDTDKWSWPGWSSNYSASHLMHILISNELFVGFNNDGSIVQTILLDEHFTDGLVYDNFISDHRPLGIRLYFNNCTDPNACNYDPEAIMDDGSCLYNDCADVCGGDQIMDHCGVCSDGPSANECITTDNTALYGAWNFTVTDCAGNTIDTGAYGYLSGGYIVLNADSTHQTVFSVTLYTGDCTTDTDCVSDDELEGMCNINTGDCDFNLDPCLEVNIGAVDEDGFVVSECTTRWGYIEDPQEFCWGMNLDVLLPAGTELSDGTILTEEMLVADDLFGGFCSDITITNGVLSSLTLDMADNGDDCFILTITGEAVSGCTNPDALNYDLDADVNDGSCICYEGYTLIGGECYYALNNQLLDDAWIMILPDELPENNAIYIIFDGEGVIADIGAYNTPDSVGWYSVDIDGSSFSGYIWADEHNQFYGQILTDTSVNMNIVFGEDTLSTTLIKVMDEGSCRGNWSGSFNQEGGDSRQVTFEIDENGVIQFFEGFASPVTGSFYYEEPYLAGHFSFGENDIGIEGGSLLGNTMEGIYGADAENFDGGTFSLTREPVPGCTDSNACNYNPAANVNDESCIYVEANYDCNGNCTAEVDCAGECGGSSIEDVCGVCNLDSSNDNACFTYPAEFIGKWEGMYSEYSTSDCSGVPDESGEDFFFTFQNNGNLKFEHPDRINGEYSCSDYPDCVVESEGLYGICHESGDCMFQVIEDGIWGINENKLCFKMGSEDDGGQSKDLTCGDFNFTDEENSLTITTTGDSDSGDCIVINLSRLKYTISIDSSTEIFDATSFVLNWRQGESIFETNIIEVVRDTIFQVGYQEPGSEPVDTTTIVTPLFPTLGSKWSGMFSGPAHFEVQELTHIIVPADTALAYIYQIHNLSLEEYRGSMTFATDLGMLSMMQIFGSDTFSIVLESKTIVGGNGVFPLAVGNEWVYVDGNYDDMQIQGCTKEEACNYVEYADIDDDSCEYAEENYDCDGNCIVEIDCAEVCGGTAELDVCEVCGGNGPAEGIDCYGQPLSLFNGLIPEDFSIHSIYPNPFNPVTNIIYGLPEHVNVQIVVYDLTGKKVATLINQFQTPGYHSINWNADNHPSGVYFVKIVAGDYINIQKLMLMK